MRDCDAWLARFEAALEGDLPEAGSRELVGHLRECGACREAVRRIALVHRRLIENAAHSGRTVSRRRERNGFWKFAAAAAAAAFLLANFSASVTHRGEPRLRAARPVTDLQADARAIRELLPELTEEESRRRALLLRVPTPAAPLPVVRGRIPAKGEDL